METLEYRTVNKASWSRGEWDNEPDKRQWQDEATGLPCLIVRGPGGSLCGYVGVPATHPHHGKNYDDMNVDVHGGLTFASACSHGTEATGICHKPSPGESDNVWWFGFDCAHWQDFCPSMDYRIVTRKGTYRNLSYVKEQCELLASQLASI